MTSKHFTKDEIRKAAYRRRVEELKKHLRGHARRVAAALLGPDANTAKRARWTLPSPVAIGQSSDAFSIRVTGPNAGQWIDFSSGDKGDLLGLVMRVKQCDFKAAVAWAEDELGLRSMTEQQHAATSKRLERQQRVEDADEAKKRAERIQRACFQFSQALPIEGSLVDTYLQSRGISLAQLGDYREKRWLRFLPSATYWMNPNKPKFPAMIAGMVNGQGVMQGVHITFLRSDGRGKADVKCKRLCGKTACAKKGCELGPKLMWPQTNNLVIRLMCGHSQRDPEAHVSASRKPEALVLCEGIEDGLSLAMGDETMRVWAAASLWNLANVPDHPCADSFVVAQDNDWGKPQALEGFNKGLAHLRSFKKPVVAIRSTTGKDFNDQLMEKQ